MATAWPPKFPFPSQNSFFELSFTISPPTQGPFINMAVFKAKSEPILPYSFILCWDFKYSKAFLNDMPFTVPPPPLNIPMRSILLSLSDYPSLRFMSQFRNADTEHGTHIGLLPWFNTGGMEYLNCSGTCDTRLYCISVPSNCDFYNPYIICQPFL